MSREALPQVTVNNEKEINNYEMMDYIDSENFEFDKEQKTLLDKIMKNSGEIEAIGHLAKDLNYNIDVIFYFFFILLIKGLDGKIHNILTKHHKDYITTFNEFMDTVRKDLKEKIERMEKIEKDKRKNENILLVITERDFFRQEAIRLNQLCKELSLKVEAMNKDIKFLGGEVTNITSKWKESENTNKQLVLELERNVKANKNMENKLKNIYANQNNFNSSNTNFKSDGRNSKEFNNFQINGNSHDNFPMNNLINENNNLNNFANFIGNNNNFYNLEDFDMNNIQFFNIKEKEKIMKIIDKLKYELKKERTRNNKIIGEFNKMLLDKNKLEKIFIDSVEEIRKDIMQRKIRDNLNNTKNNFANFMNIQSQKKKEVFPIINDVKFENFLSTDKKKLIEIFIANEEVVNFLRENIFKINFDEQKAKDKIFGTNTMSYFNFSGKSLRKTSNLNILNMNSNRSKTPNIF